MKLTTTRNLIVGCRPCSEGVYRFDTAYPNIDNEKEVSLIDLLENGHNTLEDVLWVIRNDAVKQHHDLTYRRICPILYQTNVTLEFLKLTLFVLFGLGGLYYSAILYGIFKNDLLLIIGCAMFVFTPGTSHYIIGIVIRKKRKRVLKNLIESAIIFGEK